MTMQVSSQRREHTRSATWPPSPKRPRPAPTIEPSQSIQLLQPTPHTSTLTPAEAQAFKDDLDQHPERHFLSPVSADEYWDSDPDSDSDDNDGDGEWNAGITDFALFSADRRRATETGEPLGEEWTGFVQRQGDAFWRSVERVRLHEAPDGGVPELTPDVSPDMRDDLDEAEPVEGEKLVVPWIQVPDYLTIEVKPAQPTTTGCGPTVVGPDDDLPLFLGISPKKSVPRTVERPGLRHARTLSGKRHVWRKPGEEMFTVGEDVIGEEEAEREHAQDFRMGRSTGALGMGSRW